mgnify:CR=1 FL=1
MKTLILLLLISGACSAQNNKAKWIEEMKVDSVLLTVKSVKKVNDSTFRYKLTDQFKYRYFTLCTCLHKEGDAVMVARSDMEFIEPTKN